MSFLPTVNDELCRINNIKIQTMYKNEYTDLNDPEIDDSHIHSCYEIYVNIAGDVSFLHGSEVYTIGSGDVIFSNPGDVHHCIYHSSCVHEFYCIWFSLPPDSSAEDFIRKNSFGGLMKYDAENSNRLFNILKNLNNSKNSHGFEKTVHFLSLIEALSKRANNPEKSDTSLPLKISDILEYIGNNFPTIHSMEDVASKFYVSVPTMNRWFKEHINLSPYKFLTAKKLSFAEKLLREGNTVTDACFQAGFRDCSRFISLFKSHYEKTPFQYQKEFIQTKKRDSRRKII